MIKVIRPHKMEALTDDSAVELGGGTADIYWFRISGSGGARDLYCSEWKALKVIGPLGPTPKQSI